MTDTIENLKKELAKIKILGNEYWMKNLNKRKIKELEFHDLDRDKSRVEASKASDTFEKFYGNKKYYKTIRRSSDYLKEWINKCAKKGGVFLDYACGNGHNAILAAEMGIDLAIGIDISSVSVNNCIDEAKKKKLMNIEFLQADAEDTRLPDNSIDYIICSGMLHHLDLSYAFPEIRRILKPGGKILAFEALDYNPLIKLYRYLTPEMRTDWEKAHILSLKDIKFAERFFIVNEIRYWHVIGFIGGKIKLLSKLSSFIDRFLEKIPFLNRLAWIFTFELIKPLN